MEKLELKHLAPYLPYGVKVFDMYDNNTKILYTASLSDTNSVQLKTHIEVLHGRMLEEIKPILRPLSDLTKEIKVNGESFVPIERLIEDFDKYGENGFDFSHLDIYTVNYPYYIVSKLFSWHFDVFGLIPKGLAIYINTIKNEIEDGI